MMHPMNNVKAPPSKLCGEDFLAVADVLEIQRDPQTIAAWNKFIRARPDDFFRAITEGLPEGTRVSVKIDQKGKLDVTSRLEKDGKQLLEHHFTAEIKAGVASLEYIRVAGELQGRGIAKSAIANMLEFLQGIGVWRTKTEAAYDNGAFTWARFGLKPDSLHWERLKKNTLWPRLEMMREQIPPDALKQIETAAASDDPSAIWLIAGQKTRIDGVPIGRLLLYHSAENAFHEASEWKPPTKKDIWKGIANSARERLSGLEKQLPPQVVQHLKECLDDPSPEAHARVLGVENRVGGISLGQFMLVGAYWKGELDMKNEMQREIFTAYTASSNREAPAQPKPQASLPPPRS